jgi:hypothetical protein
MALDVGSQVCCYVLAEIVQLGTDRVVAFVFGTGEGRCCVILELYAGGNLILTDDKFSILSLLRTHDYDDTVKVAVREIYPFAAATKGLPTLADIVSSSSDGDASAVADVGLADQITTLLTEAAARVIEGKERKKATLKAALSQRVSPVGDFGYVCTFVFAP